MKQNFALTLSLMGGLMLLASACVKEKTDDEKLRPVGSEIIFAAATSYENDDRTRTVYTGKDESGQYVTTNSSIERIDWENNDRVSIVYVPGSPSQAEYKVTNVLTSTDENDEADVVPSGSSKLVWAPAGSTDIFYAMYPTANGNHANNDADLVFSNNTANVQGVIPSSQPVDLSRTQSVPVPGSPNQTYNRYLPDMKYAYMVGYADGSCRDGSRVTIPFTPAVTAFNFIFKAASAVTVTGFEMSTTGAGNVGTTLAGDFNFNISGPKMRNNKVVGATWGTVNRTGPANDNGKTITVSFSQDITLSANQYLDFTVFTLPIMQKGITIKFNLKNVTNGVTTNYDKTLDLKDKTTGNWHEFAAGKKHVVTNDQLAGDNVTWVFEVTPTLAFNYQGEDNPDATQAVQQYSVTSYKQIGSSASNRYPVAWEATEYKEGNGSWGSNPPAWLKVFTHSDSPSDVTTAYEAALAPSPRTGTLGGRAKKGTEENPYDLSVNGATANCYVVDAPGWYRFPMVYGNGSYSFSGSGTYFLNTLLNHTGNPMNSKYIANQTGFSIDGVQLVWQDSEDLVSKIGFYDHTSNQKHDGGYVKFYVSPATINPGNAVIAVKSGNNIAWSWHIWVTDHSMTPKQIRSKQFMEVNLGWCDEGSYLSNARTVQVKLVQADSGEQKIITINQTASQTVELYNTNPHYQWGRKDPFIPPMGLKDNGDKLNGNKIVYDASGTTIQGIYLSQSSTLVSTATIQDGILNPTTMYSGYKPAGSNHGQFSWLNNPKCNLWNFNQTEPKHDPSNSTGYRATDISPQNHGKTVYDPCPIGYTVPTGADFSGFRNYPAYNNVYSVYNNYTTSLSNGRVTIDNNYWPALGQRAAFLSDANIVFTSSGAHNLGTKGCYQTSVAWLDTGDNTLVIETPGTVNMTQSAQSSARSVRCVPE